MRYERGGHEDVRGLPVDTRVYKAGDIVPLPTVEPELDGHVFIGWGALVGTQLTLIDENNTEHDLASNHYFKSGVSYSDRVIGNIKAFKMPELRDWVIYLGLTPNFDEAHSITYELNGGCNAAGAKDKYGYSEGFHLPEPTKKGYTFQGWYADEQFSASKITEIKAYSYGGDKTFYAKWSDAIKYNITYDLNGGNNASNAKTTYTVEDSYTLPTPTKNGYYKFMGWYTDSNFSGNAVTNIEAGSTGNKTFYAKWTPIQYSITYELNGGTNPANAQNKYAYGEKFPLPVPTKTGYTFIGWYTNSSFTDSTKVTQIAAGSTGDKIFYAKWLKKIKMVSLQGGTVPLNKTYSPKVSGFSMSETEITQKQWQEVVGSPGKPSEKYGKGDDFPMYSVSWYDALVFCNKLSLAEGKTPCYSIKGSTNPDAWGTPPSNSNTDWNNAICDWNAGGYRLPTVAEWVYAARGGQDYTYAGSNDMNEVAWYVGNSDGKAHAVKGKKPNDFGLYDMSGNVMEWCWDWSIYDRVQMTDPTGADSGSYRFYLGGCWDFDASYCAVSYRDGYYPNNWNPHVGFRVVCRP